MKAVARARAVQAAPRAMRTPASVHRPVPVQRGERCACGGHCPSCRDLAEGEADAAADRVVKGLTVETIRAVPGGAAASDAPPLTSKGRQLPSEDRVTFEHAFRTSLPDIRLHDDAEADAAARSLSAQAYTVGTDIVLSRRTPILGRGADSWLMAHEIAHVLQQKTHGPAVQRAPVDTDILGRRSALVARPNLIYFEKGSSTLHTDEAAKLPGIIAATQPDIRIKGFRSRDEDPKLAGKRADAVKTAITARNAALKPVTQPEPTAFQDQVDYRRFRLAQPLKDTKQTAKSTCPATAAKFETTCPVPPAGAVDVPKAFGAASGDLDNTIKKLTTFKSAPAGNKATEKKLLKFFKPGFDIDRLIGDYTKIKLQLDSVGKQDMGTGNKRPGYRCANNCSADCSDATAVTNEVGPKCRVTLCPSTWAGSKPDAITTLIHECSHCTDKVGIAKQGTDDVIYEREKAIPFLSAKEAVRSADLFALFVRELIHGGKDTILPTVTDDVSGLSKNQKTVEEALARLAKWLQVSGDTLRSLFDEVIDARSSGWGPSWGEDTYREIHKQFGKEFGLTRPSRKPKEKDVHAVAAIADRVTLLDTMLDANKVKAREGVFFTTWATKSKTSPGVLPGLVVEVDSDIAGIIGVRGIIFEMLEALLKAAPHISDPMVPKYLALIDWIRKDEKIGP